jgi:hypothetical protein
MAAGLGFKTFNTGDVLSAADVNGYLMQGILVFADATARDAAITAPEEGQFAFLKDTNVTTYYTGSAWANVDTTGMTNPMTTTGDLIYSSSGSTPARLGIGTAGQVLQVNSGATAPEWGTPATTPTFTGVQTFKQTSNQTITNATNTLVTWNGENFDSDGFHDNSVNNSRLTVPAGLGGKYWVYANFISEGDVTTAFVRLYKNGTQVQLTAKRIVAGSENNGCQINFTIDLAATDYMEVYYYQASGTNGLINGTAGTTYSAFGMYRVGV